MTFFKVLAGIGIGREQLAGITDEDMPRIEKRLIAESRLNNSISKNDIDQVIKLLKAYPDVIRTIGSYECLYGILTVQTAEYVDEIRPVTKEALARMRYVLSNYFYEDVVNYINRSSNKNNWNDLRVLVHYKNFLSTVLLELMVQKLSEKLDSALLEAERLPPHSTLNKKAGFLKEDEFYVLLSDVDTRYFSKYMDALLGFIARRVNYTRGTIFFDKVLTGMRSYNTSDRVLNTKILNAIAKYGGQAWKVYTFFGGFFILLFWVVIHVASRPAIDYSPNNNLPTDELQNQQVNADFGPESYRKEQTKQMENFVEARRYTLFYPLGSWHSPKVKVLKYQDPFTSAVFNRDFSEIKHGGQSINIINQTANECVVLAYFDRVYIPWKNNYGSDGSLEIHKLYALYIPANDSIKIDFKMYLLRFYMGRDLRSFNTYKHHIYNDLADVKFRRFTSADSMLFSKAVVFYDDDNWKGKQQDLIITQPTVDSYKISWTGERPLYQHADWSASVTNKLPDSATKHKPLIFNLKDKMGAPGNESGEQGNSSFLEYQDSAYLF